VIILLVLLLVLIEQSRETFKRISTANSEIVMGAYLLLQAYTLMDNATNISAMKVN